ncbi:Uncharacterized protein TCM_028862 [Theobroma cacao]|uniref:Uncharacterized protein n=1 Tax=Theobroma cacao TaxID=3641 RepID=A0A061GBC6_THECC|nr:Uncharacterized protein TCM_028862 [Theobroma cacao]
MLFALEGQVSKMEVVMGEVKDRFKEFKANIKELRSRDGKLYGKMQSILNESVDMLNQQDVMLKNLVKVLKQRYKGLRMSFSHLRCDEKLSGMAISTWMKFQKQLYLKYVNDETRAKLRSGKEAFLAFLNDLKPWAKLEL